MKARARARRPCVGAVAVAETRASLVVVVQCNMPADRVDEAASLRERLLVRWQIRGGGSPPLPQQPQQTPP